MVGRRGTVRGGVGGGGLLVQFAGHGRRKGAGKAPDPFTQMSGLVCGR